MKITKLNKTIAYKRICEDFALEVNGKKVRVSALSEMDIDHPINDEYDTDINETDFKALTELEQEALGENLTEILELKDGESIDVD